MKSNAFYAILGVGIILVIGVIWWGTHRTPQKPAASVATSTPATATSTPALTGMSIYTNGQYGFSVLYPGGDIATTTFSTYYQLPNTWRFSALPNATGTPIIAIIGYQTKSDDSYPRYFDTEVRVGASADPQELAACAKVGDGEQSEPDAVINGVTWKTFAFESVGMMQYAKGISYRTVHDGTCFAMEQIETGSSYRDDPPSSKDIPDATLSAHYDALSSVIQSFSFARS